MESICIVTPCFNAAPYILECMESVASQSGMKRHIIMDGGSADGTLSIIEEYAEKHPHVVWKSEMDEGQSDALIKALELVDTEYYGWLNADDCYIPDSLNYLIQHLANDDKPTIVYGDYQGIDQDSRVIKYRRQPSFNYWDCLHGYLTIQNCAAIFHTQKTKDSNAIDKELQFAMDYNLFLKLAGLGTVLHVRRYVGQFRFHSDAKTSKLQDVCAFETDLVRLKSSEYNSRFKSISHFFAKCRVALRMIREDCVRSRFGFDMRD